MSPSFWLYVVAGIFDLAALVLVLRHVPARIRTARTPASVEPQPPMIYNEHMSAIQVALLGRTPEMVEVHARSTINELIEAIKMEAAIRAEQDSRLASLLDAPEGIRDVVISSILLVIAVAFGTAGNLVGAWNK